MLQDACQRSGQVFRIMWDSRQLKFLSSPQTASISHNLFCALEIYFPKSCYIYPLQLEIIEIESKKKKRGPCGRVFCCLHSQSYSSEMSRNVHPPREGARRVGRTTLH